MLGTVIVMAIVFIPVWVQIVKKMTLMPAWRLALLVSSISVIPLYFTNTLILSAIAVVAVGFGMGGVSTTMDIVAARILDEDAAKHGVQREGTYSSLLGILNKSSGLFSSLAYLLVFRFYGFESGANPGAAPDQAARFLTVLFPLAVLVVCVVMSRFLKFEQGKGRKEEGENGSDHA
ncbi:MAG: MFS transporter [Acutalibacteraceae bacterium]